MHRDVGEPPPPLIEDGAEKGTTEAELGEIPALVIPAH